MSEEKGLEVFNVGEPNGVVYKKSQWIVVINLLLDGERNPNTISKKSGIDSDTLKFFFPGLKEEKLV